MSIKFDFSGKKCLITGVTGGIGASIAKLFLESNAQVVGTSTSEQKLEYYKDSNNFTGIVANMENREDVVKIVEKANNIMSGIDILVCNAGITDDALAVRITNEAWDKIMTINLDANFILNREAAKVMMKAKYGRIINITSLLAYIGNPGQTSYAATKAGLTGLTRCLAVELASRNITVNAIAPGFIATDMTSKVNVEHMELIKGMIPMKKMGMPEDVANAVLFLSSDDAKYITGTTLHINGGLYVS